MVKASPTQRLGAFLIDAAIIWILLSIIMRFVTKNITMPVLEGDVINVMGDNLKDYFLKDKDNFLLNVILTTDEKIKAEYNAWILTTEYIQFYDAYTSAVFQIAGIAILSLTFIVCIYMVILPYYWSKQTLGRLIMQVKVVNELNEKPRFRQLLVRELVGGVLVLVFDFLFFIPTIINIVYIMNRSQSIGDMTSGLTLIRYDEESRKENKIKDDDSNIINNRENILRDDNDNKEEEILETDIIIDLDEE